VKGAALIGIAFNLIGVLMLFRYGMPFRVDTDGDVYVRLGVKDEEIVRTTARYRLLGNIGLALIVLGTTLQAVAVVLS
jgi:hypothetical protein